MDSIKDILTRFDPFEDKYISREFQAYGCYLAEKLGADRQKSLYIKLAKTLPRPVLEKALTFVVDSNARSKAALFMWKLKEMGILGNPKPKSPKVKKPEKIAKPPKSTKGSKKLEKEYAPQTKKNALEKELF